jgi:predicted ATP-binding protein involved in virulence
MIRRLYAKNLNGMRAIDLSFNEDVNVITGKNGSGKTTILKAIWFLLSGNAERVSQEMTFHELLLETDTFSVHGVYEQRPIHKRRRPTAGGQTVEEVINWTFRPIPLVAPENIRKIVEPLGTRERQTTLAQLRTLDSWILAFSATPSLFFPTFRRIEGGFGMAQTDNRYYTPANIDIALRDMSQRLSISHHRFVSSISTNDIVSHLTTQYTQISEKVNADHAALTTDIVQSIQNHEELSPNSATAANDTLEGIRKQVTIHKARQEALLAPFTALNTLVRQIFQHKGIRVTPGMTLGETTLAIASEVLSAGEKQMLSFLAYNAFEHGSIIFIDEPEISLHVDWQRTLVPTLLEQGGNNQFIMATHSPFIYSKFADKELIIDQDRGDSTLKEAEG